MWQNKPLTKDQRRKQRKLEAAIKYPCKRSICTCVISGKGLKHGRCRSAKDG